MEIVIFLSVPPKRGCNTTCHEKLIPVLQADCNSYYLLVQLGNSDFHYSDLGHYPRVSPIYFGDKVHPREVWQH